MKLAFRAPILCLLLCLISAAAQARVVRVEVLSRAAIDPASPGVPAYEKIVARVYFAVRPGDIHNQPIVDLDGAPKNTQGEVEFSSDLYLLRPVAKSNGAMLLEIPNRGGKGLLQLIDGGKGDPANASDLGDAWLLRQGFTFVSLGWQWDVAEAPGSLRLYAPVAYEKTGKHITGLLRDDFTPTEAATDWPLGHVMGNRLGGVEYPVAAPDDKRNVLTVRDSPHGQRRVIPAPSGAFRTL